MHRITHRTAHRTVAVALFAAIAGTASGAFAQQNNPMSYETISKAKNGQWAEFNMSMKGQAQAVKMRYAIVERTDKLLGLEIDSNTPMGPVIMHLQFAPNGDVWSMSRAAVSAAGHKQFLTSEQMKAGDIKKADTPGKLLGSETVTVPAGKFEAKHYQRKQDMPGAGEQTLDVWMSDKAPPTGLVKLTATNGIEAVLTALGADAKSQLSLDDKAAAAPAAAQPQTAGDKPAATKTPAKSDKK